MKKLIFIALMFSTLTIAMGQDKGSYITVGGDLGWTKFFYDLDEGSSRGKLGYGGNIGYQYFFSKHWGVGIQAEFSVFNTQSRFDNKQFTFDGQFDDVGDDVLYDLNIALNNWRENQKTYFFDIPLMLMYQTRFGQSKNVGMYGGVGAKAQLPIKSTYKRHKGEAGVFGHYPDWNLTILPEFPLPAHNYGTNGDLGWKGDNELKFGVAVTGELGFLFALNRRIDLTVGVSADYGLMDIKDKNVELLYPTGVQQEGDYIAQKVAYNGVLNSQEIDKNHPFALKGELGLRIKIGKVSEERKPKIQQQENRQDEIIGLLKDIANRPADTVVVNPIIEVVLPEQPTDDYDYYSRIRKNGKTPSSVSEGKDAVEAEAVEFLMEPVFFDLDKANLRKDAIEILNRKIELLQKYDHIRLTIVGHTCDLGSREHNYELSSRRADAVRMYLINKGVRPSRLSSLPEGMSNPYAQNSNEENRQLNRRVDFIVGK